MPITASWCAGFRVILAGIRFWPVGVSALECLLNWAWSVCVGDVAGDTMTQYEPFVPTGCDDENGTGGCGLCGIIPFVFIGCRAAPWPQTSKSGTWAGPFFRRGDALVPRARSHESALEVGPPITSVAL